MKDQGSRGPEWPDDLPATEDESFDSLGALLRSAPPPPMPPPAHLERLNRAVMERVTRERGLRRLVALWGETIQGLWHRPLSQRGLATVGALGCIAVGLWVGLNMPPGAADKADRELASVPAPSTDDLHLSARNRADITHFEPPIAAVEAHRTHPEETESTARLRAGYEGRDEVMAAERADVIEVTAAPAREQSLSDPFEGLTIYPELGQQSVVDPEWVALNSLPAFSEINDFSPSLTLRNLAPINRPGGILRESEPSDDPSLPPVTSAGETSLNSVARTIVDDDLLGELRRFKLDLYLSGDTETIPSVQRIEEVLCRILATQAEQLSAAAEIDLETQQLFAQAEQQLLRRDYRRAEQIFNEIAHSHPGTRVAALSWYHLGDICFDFHGDFPGARQSYARCLEGTSKDLFPAETMERIDHRLALLDDSAARDHLPLRLLRQAEAAPPGSAALAHYSRLLVEFPDSAAAADAINSLAERAMREVPAAPDMPHQAIRLLRGYQALETSPHASLAQLRLADIVYYGLRDYQQAVIEYSQVRVEPGDEELARMISERIGQMLDNRVSAREF
jgi:tetratricopeptide (TPR) repeat protein